MIDEYKYGRFVVDGQEFLGDIMLINGKAHFWQERKGRKLRKADINELLAENPEVLVIGTGAGGLLQVPEEIIEHIHQQGNIFLFVENNTDAIEEYNKAEKSGKKVCGIFPSSC